MAVERIHPELKYFLTRDVDAYDPEQPETPYPLQTGTILLCRRYDDAYGRYEFVIDGVGKLVGLEYDFAHTWLDDHWL